MALTRCAAVVFDLDGTLVDSRPDLTLAINRLRRALGLPLLDETVVETMIGEGARLLVERALADAPSEVSRESALQEFLTHYSEVCTRATRPYAGIGELLHACGRRWPLALLTNKPIAMTRSILEHLGWSGRFHSVVGGDSLPFRKPDGRGLVELARRLGVERPELVLVGDSRIDAETATAAGTQFVWVEWGFARPEERRGLAGGNSARTPADLGRWLEARPQ
jgi:phosphoglycolate phosphatase